jgi:phage major head subunit gpT-like protein
MGAQELSMRAVVSRFYQKLEEEQIRPGNWHREIGMYLNSDQESETHAWIGNSPMMRRWIGERQASGLRTNKFIVPNVDYEASLEIKRRELQLDKSGQVQVRIDDMAKNAEAHWGVLMSDLIAAGESTPCYDGKNLFAADHVEGENKTNQSNIDTYDISDGGTGGTPEKPTIETFTHATLDSIARFYQVKNDKQEFMNQAARAFTIMVPVALMKIAMAALTVELGAGGATNLLKAQTNFQLKFEVNPRLSTGTEWYVFRTDATAKPFILQELEGVTTEVLGEGSEHAVKYGRYLFGVRAARAVAPGFWQYARKVKLAA